MPAATKPELHVDTVEQWEEWLSNTTDPTGVFLRLRKKGSTAPGITYAEALDVALCFGWIDGLSKSLDADYHLRSFTPRRPRSLWSKVNIEHVTRLIAEGRMQPAGQAEIDRAQADGRWDNAYRHGEVAAELQAVLDADPALAASFAALSAQQRFAMSFRLQSLKREASRRARLEEIVAALRTR